MKKFLCFMMLLVFAGMLMACGSSDNIPLTDEESDAIAQYCAHLILKHDNNKTAVRKLLDIDEIEDIYKEAHKNDPTPTPKPTKAPGSASSGKSGNSGKSGSTGSKSEAGSSPAPDKSTAEAYVDNSRPKAESLTKLYSAEGFTVEYKSGSSMKVYSENEYSTISAKDGEMIYAVEFTIKNIGDSKARFVSNNSNVSYMLYCENGDIYAPQISMLSNDILFLNDEIAAGKEYTAVLLFFVNEDRTPGLLRAENGETGKVFDIKL